MTGGELKDELKMLTNLNFSVIRANRSPSKTLSKQVVPVKYIPNIFHDCKVFYELSDEEKIQKISSMPNISIFMVVELCYCMKVLRTRSLNDTFIPKITQIFASKSLCRVPSTFIQSFGNHVLTKLPTSVVSEDDTAVIVCTKISIKPLVTTSKLYKLYFQHPAAPHCKKDSELYKLYFQHPAAPHCKKHSECGFVLTVSPCLKEEAGKFDIQLVTEESEYPAGIHCHSEVINAAHMHLVVERYCYGRWYNMLISWMGKPEYSEEEGGVELNGRWGENATVRLVVYYDIRHTR